MDHTPGFLRIVDAVRGSVPEISVAEAVERQKGGARLIDVREDSEWDLAHAVGAEHIGRGVIERDIETKVPAADTELLLYCGGGFRSLLASEALKRMGYTNVSSVSGGWRAWQDAGAPIERSEPSA